MTNSFEIAGRMIGPGEPPYLIAELSGNHGGDFDRTRRLIDAAKAAGADAVKIQTFTPDTITIDHDGEGFRLGGGLWEGRTLYDLYREASLPWDWHEALFRHAAEAGITLFSSPFDATAIELLERCRAPAFKIASFELVDLPLIRRAAQTGKPVILSTGMADLGEIGEAVATMRATSAAPVMLLHCTSGYPTPAAECDLRTIPHLAAAFGVPVGLSDHTLGWAVPVASVALGAVAIEKHFILSRAEGGTDSAFSLEPAEFAAMVEACRIAAEALGAIDYGVKPSESGGRHYRRSLYVVEDVPAGALLSAANIRSIRPGFGLAPKLFDTIIGRRAARMLHRGEPVDWSMIASAGS
jgi:N-acetylneuraminate synthase